MPADPQYDKPKTLGDAEAKAARMSQIHEPHIAPLTAFVEDLRTEVGPEYQIPYFDPWDGGIAAEVLYLLEAPGPQARSSGFVSRNNPDETAKNFFKLNIEAGIPRTRTVVWNAVPWYIGIGNRIRAANNIDISNSLRSLARLLGLLPHLRVIVLVGRKAERVEQQIRELKPKIEIFKSPHPSPMFVNRAPDNPDKLRAALRRVADFLAISNA